MKSILFMVFSLLLSVAAIAAPGRKITCQCYGEKNTLWPDGSAYKWVPGCASGRGSSPECMDRMSRETAAFREQCTTLIEASCPNQPKCLEDLDSAINDLSESKGIFPDYLGDNSTKIISQQVDKEVYSGGYNIPHKDAAGHTNYSKGTVTFTFTVSEGKCGEAKVDIKE